MAYKGGVSDLRESPSLKLVELLRADGAEVSYHDPYVDRVDDLGLASVPLTPDALAASDAVVISTHHRITDIASVVANARLVIDLRNAVRQTLNGSPSGATPPNVRVL